MSYFSVSPITPSCAITSSVTSIIVNNVKLRTVHVARWISYSLRWAFLISIRLYYATNIVTRSIRKILTPMVPSRSLLRHGVHPQNCQDMHNKMLMSSSSQHWTKFTPPHAVPLMSLVIVLFTPRSPVNCKAMSNANDVVTSPVRWTPCWISVSSSKGFLVITHWRDAYGGQFHVGICLGFFSWNCVRFTQPEKLGPKEYSCGKCGKASNVCFPCTFFKCRSSSHFF